MGNTPSTPTSSVSAGSPTTFSSCPPVTLTTQTAYTEVVIPGPTTTLAQTATSVIWPSTVTSTPTSTITSTKYAATSTFTQTTSTSVIFSIVPPTATTSVPTPASFTPVRCDKAYFNPTTTVTYTNSAGVAIYPTVTSSARTPLTVYDVPVYRTTTINLPGVTTVTRWPTVTTTSVRNERTTTLYAACATNNVVADAPGTSNKYILDVLAKYQYTELKPYPAVDAVDCCGRCQARNECTGSVWFTNRDQKCQHLVKVPSANAACNARSTGGLAQNTWDQPNLYISNGRCGQWTFDGPNFDSK